MQKMLKNSLQSVGQAMPDKNIWKRVYETLTDYKYEIIELSPYIKEILNDDYDIK